MRLPHITRKVAIPAALAALGLWMGYTFVQEAYLSHRLNQQAAALRLQNAELQAQNDGYRRDIQAMQSGAGSEEQARLNGYARSDEKVYLIGGTPTPAPPAAAPAGSGAAGAKQGSGGGLLGWIRR